MPLSAPNYKAIRELTGCGIIAKQVSMMAVINCQNWHRSQDLTESKLGNLQPVKGVRNAVTIYSSAD